MHNSRKPYIPTTGRQERTPIMAHGRRVLSPEIVSLIHHVELNQRGWWKKAIAQVVQAALWVHQQPCDIGELLATIKSQLGANPTIDSVQKALDSLLTSKTAQVLPGKRYKLSEAAKNEFARTVDKSQQEQETAKQEFLQALNHFCRELDAESTWRRFSEALAQAISQIGANAYHLLVDGSLERDFDWLREFLDGFPPEDQEGLKATLAAFFRPTCVASRAFVLQRLTAYFFLEAAQLKQETIEAVESRQGKKRTIRLVLDTNVLFSILGMHENPMDSTAESLLKMATTGTGHADVRLLVLPRTIEEARRVLIAIESSLEGMRYARVVSAAAASMPLSSVAARYFAQNAAAGGALSPREYFAPYIDDLGAVLRAKGIDVLSWPTDHYGSQQGVIDDVLHWQEHEKRRRPEGERRSYEAILHDVILWHALKDRRTSHTESPLDVENWGVTLDGRLVGFDIARRQRDGASATVPLVLHLTNMVQLLQFWIPRSEALEASIMDSLRLPLFFPTFDQRDEETTIGILKAISRYENADDLPEETVRAIVANQALRTRIREGDANAQETFEFVRDALIEEHRKVADESRIVREELSKTKAQMVGVDRQLREFEREREDAARTITAQESEISAERQARDAAERSAEEHRRRAQSLSEQVAAAEARLQQIELKQLRGDLITRVCLSLGGAGLFGFALALLCERSASGELGVLDLLAVGGIAGLALLAVLLKLLQRYIQSREILAGWWLARTVSYCSRNILWPLVTLVGVALLEAGALSWLQDLAPKVFPIAAPSQS